MKQLMCLCVQISTTYTFLQNVNPPQRKSPLRVHRYAAGEVMLKAIQVSVVSPRCRLGIMGVHLLGCIYGNTLSPSARGLTIRTTDSQSLADEQQHTYLTKYTIGSV